ncbi:MAG: argininosuccinate synthase [Candidatus Bathyarchaeota archaeon]|nr:argininosuccinate synthase [Candidatus Bathyarchaeota archaeon]
MKQKIVLAYSGGLDTSVAIKWIQKKYNAEVISVIVDVGQSKDLVIAEEKAKKLGVLTHYTIDAKQEFLTDYVFPAIKANAMYEGKYPISTALSRPLIASKLVEIAKKESANGVAHGCTGKGNDQVRFDITIKSLDPNLKIIAPVREWGLSREEEIEFAKKNGIPLPKDSNVAYSVDQNLWGRSIECGVLENPMEEPPEDVYQWTKSQSEAPDKEEYISIKFENGKPIAINGKELNGLELIERISAIAGKHGIGRIDHMENRIVGIKSREVYECPAAKLLIEAHMDLEKLVLTRHEFRFKQQVDVEWSSLAYSGLWMDPLKSALDAFIEETQQRVTGEVKIKLYKGNCYIVGRYSDFSLYDIDLATYGPKTTFDQSWSLGFIEIWGLPTTVANIKKRNLLKNPAK